MRRKYDSDILRQYNRDRAFAAQRRYAAMSDAQQRAYARRHPAFVSQFGNAVPEHLRFAMADAYDAHGPEAADALFDAHLRRVNAAATAADLARSRMAFGERLVWLFVWLVAFGVVAAVALPTAAVAAGRHGVAVAATFLGASWLVYALWRLCSGSR